MSNGLESLEGSWNKSRIQSDEERSLPKAKYVVDHEQVRIDHNYVDSAKSLSCPKRGDDGGGGGERCLSMPLARG